MSIDFESIGLDDSGEMVPYFCTPLDAEYAGRLGVDGIHFILLPGDERVFCADPSMGEPGSYVLPVGADFREFLSFLLYCRDASPLSQIWWLSEERFQKLLEEDAAARWPGCEAYLARKAAALEAIAAEFGLSAAYPYARVKELQSAFDPAALVFSKEYYDVLGIGPI